MSTTERVPEGSLKLKTTIETTLGGLLIAIRVTHGRWGYIHGAKELGHLAWSYTDCLYLWREYLFTPEEISAHERELYDLLESLDGGNNIKDEELWRLKERLRKRLSEPGGKS